VFLPLFRRFTSRVIEAENLFFGSAGIFFKEGDLRGLSCRENSKKIYKYVNSAGIFLIFLVFLL
jgi:hypothetical protein